MVFERKKSDPQDGRGRPSYEPRPVVLTKSQMFVVRKRRWRSLISSREKCSMRNEDRETLFQRWLRDHIGLMLKVVRTCAATPNDQEDLFQDVLVSLWTSIPNFRGDAKELTCLAATEHLLVVPPAARNWPQLRNLRVRKTRKL